MYKGNQKEGSMTYKVTCHESADADVYCDTLEEAEKVLAEYEEEDRKNGCYRKGFWYIKEVSL